MPTAEEMAAALNGDPWAVAANKLRQGVQPAGGRPEGVASQFLTQYVPHVAQGLATLPQRALAASEAMRAGGDYDPRPALEAATWMAGGRIPTVKTGELGTFGGRPMGFLQPGKQVATPVEKPAIMTYHASPHKFDQFDISKLGTGQGANAFGEGVYLAQHPSTMFNYFKEFVERVPVGTPERLAAAQLEKFGGDRSSAIDVLKRYYDVPENKLLPSFGSKENLKKAVELLESGQHSPYRYKVAMKANPEHLLDWDAKMIEQSPYVQEAAKRLGIPVGEPARVFLDKKIPSQDPNVELVKGFSGDKSFIFSTDKKTGETSLVGREHTGKREKYGSFEEALKAVADHVGGNLTGGDVYYKASDHIGRSYRPTTGQMWHEGGGVPGVKYWDAMSRDVGKGTRNYAIYDTSLLDILKRYAVVPGAAAPVLNEYVKALQDKK